MNPTRDAERWQMIAKVAREVDAKYRGPGPGVADDDLVELIADALRVFPEMVMGCKRLQAILDAENGRKGPDGWTWDRDAGAWVLVRGDVVVARVHGRCAGRYELVQHRGRVSHASLHLCEHALEGWVAAKLTPAGS